MWQNGISFLFYLIRSNPPIITSNRKFRWNTRRRDIHRRGTSSCECKPREWLEIENVTATELSASVCRKEIKGSFIPATHQKSILERRVIGNSSPLLSSKYFEQTILFAFARFTSNLFLKFCLGRRKEKEKFLFHGNGRKN